jgi:hypothetical protein
VPVGVAVCGEEATEMLTYPEKVMRHTAGRWPVRAGPQEKLDVQPSKL